MASSLSRWILNTMVSWRSIWCNSFCGVFVGIGWTLTLWWDLSFYIHESYLSFFDLLYAWLLIASYFFSDIWDLFGQPGLFILQWEELLCSGFDLTVLDPSDRRGTDTYVSLLLRIKWWGSLYIDRSCLHHVIILIALLRFSLNLIH